MPTYQYRCGKCGEQFELWQSIHDDALQEHPGCGGPVIKVLAPAGIVLKGPGFYRTDSRSSGRKSRDGEKGDKEKRDKEKVKTADSSSKNGSGTKDESKSSSGSEGKSSAGPSKKDSSST